MGGERPSYMLFMPRQSWSEYDQLTSNGLGFGAGDSLSQTFAESIERIQTETWGYRADLTYRASKDHR